MAWLHQHLVLSIVGAVVLVSGATLFVVALPRYHPSSTTATIDMATQHHYVLADFKAQFAAQGIPLTRVRVLSGITGYRDARAGTVGDALDVTVYPRHGKVTFDSSGPKPLYQARLGNLTVFYGGRDKAFAARVAAAVSAIKR
ncbi:MAG TPA: hypothetical protein VHV52_07940 [Gaiellaceae bacterium]|jgi:hypothetical protein|nr:hypothetical protein [Gaiellaceae bacterium]